MPQQGFRLISMKLTTLATTALLSSSLTSFADERPNILIFLVDDMGLMDTSVPFVVDKDGKPAPQKLNKFYRTPNMEKLAKNGVRFSHFYANSVCSPSRISLLNGQFSARHRVTQWINPHKQNSGPSNWNWKGLTDKDVSLQKILKFLYFTFFLVDIQGAIQDCDTCTIIASVFKPFKAFYDDGVSFFFPNICDYSTHTMFYLII